MNLNWVFGGGLVVVGLVAVLGLSQPTIPLTNIDTQSIVDQVVAKLQGFGAVTGPDSQFPCETHNGVMRCFEHRLVRQATTTVCALKSPTATSSLVTGNVKFTTGTSSATRIHLAKAGTAFATTTSLGMIDLAAGAQGTFLASTTPNGTATLTIADQAWVFAPNTFFVVGVAGAITAGDTAGTGYVPVGSCNATWEVI